MIINEKFRIHAYDQNTLRVVSLTPTLSNRLNKAFSTYPGYNFVDGEEPVFSISALNIGLLAAILEPSIPRHTLKELINLEFVRYNTEELT